MVTKNEEMKRKLLRYEDVIDENKELLKINDELKLSNSDMHTMNMKLMTRTNDFERENLSFRDQVNELSKRITSMDVNIDKLIDEKVHLENELELHKIEKHKFDEVEQSLTEVSEECSSKAEYMSNVIAELSLANDALKAQKMSMEMELIEQRQENSRLSNQSFMHGIHSTPLLSSTVPVSKTPSLREELREELFDCKEEYLFDDSLQDDNHPDGIAVIATRKSFSENAAQDKFSVITQQCKKKFIEKKSLVSRKLDELMVENSPSGEESDHSKVIMDELNSER